MIVGTHRNADMHTHWDALGGLKDLCISNVRTLPPTMWTKNRCTVKKAVMTIALPVLSCSLQAHSIDYRDEQCTPLKLTSAH